MSLQLTLSVTIIGLTFSCLSRDCLSVRSQRQPAVTSSSRHLQVTFDELGRWDDVPPEELSEKDTAFFKGACDGRPWSADKLVVVAGTRHDSSWLTSLARKSPGLQYLVYQHESPEQPHYYESYANEAGAYLRFMHQYYHCLPQYVAFIHGHGQAGWHHAAMSETLENLQWPSIPGYTDLNQFGPTYKVTVLDHKGKLPGKGVKLVATGSDVYNGSFSKYQIIEGKAYSWDDWPYFDEVQFAKAYDHFFGPEGFGPMPEKVFHHCCGQFAATREAIRGRSQSFYQDALLYLRPSNNDLTGHHRANRQYVMGDMFSVFWGMMMGKSALYEKEVSDCTMFNDCDGVHPVAGVTGA